MRYVISLVFIFTLNPLLAQPNRSLPRENPFLQSQWYLGFFGGGNLAGTNATASYNGYEPLNYSLSEIEKEYNNFSKLGGHAGLVFMYYSKGFTYGLKPGFQIYNTEYSTHAQWVDSANPTNTLDINYKYSTKFNYLEFPLTVQYDLMKNKFRPYVGLGAYYAILLSATRKIERSGTDGASGSSGGFTNPPNTIGVKDLYITSSLGLKGFIGASYDPGNIRITIDIGYKYGLNNITSTENRYQNNQLSAIGDATDDLKLQNIYFTMAFVFPLKFISNQFNSVN